MSETTNIAWATSTFNPWIGCTQVGPGCDGCYAKAWDRRFAVSGHAMRWGAGIPRSRTSDVYWRQPLAWDRKARESGKPWRVFCGSLCDVFDNEVPAEWRKDLLELVRATDSLTWLLLTKRIGNAKAMLPIHWWGRDGPPPNVWIGATVVNQEEADRDVPRLLQVPAAVRFLSIEPMLGPINLAAKCPPYYAPHIQPDRIGWVIVGGESDQPGHRARPFNIEWARDIVRQCKAAGVPVFVKQLGSNPAPLVVEAGSVRERLWLKDRAGADPAEWPLDLRVREFPR